jgi:hypothetical protein
VRCQHSEPHTPIREYLQRLEIDGSFREPDALRIPTVANLEIAQPPDNLRALIRSIRKRHDHVVVGLRERGAMATKSLLRLLICIDDGVVSIRRALLQPGEQGGAYVVANARVIVDNAYNAPLHIENARRRVGRVALGGDAFVPIVIRIRRILQLDGFEPRVLAWRLIEVTVDADIAIH